MIKILPKNKKLNPKAIFFLVLIFLVFYNFIPFLFLAIILLVIGFILVSAKLEGEI